MQDFDLAGPDAVARARAEIKSRLLSAVSLTAPARPAPQEPGDRDAQAYSNGESHADPTAEACDESRAPLPADKQSDLAVASATGDDEAAEGRSDEVKWIEPVFIESIAEDAATKDVLHADAVVLEAAPPDAVPAPEAGDGTSAAAAHLDETHAPGASPRPVRFRWGRRSAASAGLVPGAAAHSKEIAADRQALVDEIAALRRTLAAERAAAEEEITGLRNTLTAEREAAADEIATLRTILAAQQEAAVARTTRLKAILGATTTFSPAVSE